MGQSGTPETSDHIPAGRQPQQSGVAVDFFFFFEVKQFALCMFPKSELEDAEVGQAWLIGP